MRNWVPIRKSLDVSVWNEALLARTELTAREVAEEAMKIAAEICLYTNDQIVTEEITS